MDADVVFARSTAGTDRSCRPGPRAAAAEDHHVWGVPTFIRVTRPSSCASWTAPVASGPATRTIERILDLLTEFPELNEFKHT